MAIAELQALAREQPSEADIYKSKWKWVEDEKWRSDEARRQVEYYFSDENLLKDDYLYDKMHGPMNRPVALKYIHGFPKMSFFQYKEVVAALKTSETLEIIKSSGEEYVKRRKLYHRPGDAPEDALMDKEIEIDDKLLKHQPLLPVRPPLNKNFARKLEEASFTNTLQGFSITAGANKNETDIRMAAVDGRGYVVGEPGATRFKRTPGRRWGNRGECCPEVLWERRAGELQRLAPGARPERVSVFAPAIRDFWLQRA